MIWIIWICFQTFCHCIVWRTQGWYQIGPLFHHLIHNIFCQKYAMFYRIYPRFHTITNGCVSVGMYRYLSPQRMGCFYPCTYFFFCKLTWTWFRPRRIHASGNHHFYYVRTFFYDSPYLSPYLICSITFVTDLITMTSGCTKSMSTRNYFRSIDFSLFNTVPHTKRISLICPKITAGYNSCFQ